MKNDFDKKIKELMDASSLADSGFELDKKEIWNKIEDKQKHTVIPFRKWFSHAAAVMIGILICLPFLFHSKKGQEQTVTITRAITTPARIIRDTVFIDNHSSLVTVKPPSVYQANTIPHIAENIAVKDIQPVIDMVADTVKNSEIKLQGIAVAENTKHKMPVMHLLDMGNENTVPKEKVKESYVLFKIINIPALSDNNAPSLSMIFASSIHKNKN